MPAVRFAMARGPGGGLRLAPAPLPRRARSPGPPWSAGPGVG